MIAITASSSMRVNPPRAGRFPTSGFSAMAVVLPRPSSGVTLGRDARAGRVTLGRSRSRRSGDRFGQRSDPVRLLPREAFAPEVTVVGGLLVDRLLEIEVADDRR